MNIYWYVMYWKGKDCKKFIEIFYVLDPYELEEDYDGNPDWSPWTKEDLGDVD